MQLGLGGKCAYCEELIALKKEVKDLKKCFEDQNTFQGVELAKERKRIKRLEDDIVKYKNALAEATAVKSTGSWGVTRKRAEIIYSRLLASIKYNGCPYISRGDAKMALGVLNYSQAAAAMEECAKVHKETRLSKRGNINVIEIFDHDAVVDLVSNNKMDLNSSEYKKDYARVKMVPELAAFVKFPGDK